MRTPNVLGTLACIRLASEHHVKLLIYVSTISVAGPTEDDTLRLQEAIEAGPYALSKWVGEAHVKRVCIQGG